MRVSIEGDSPSRTTARSQLDARSGSVAKTRDPSAQSVDGLQVEAR